MKKIGPNTLKKVGTQNRASRIGGGKKKKKKTGKEILLCGLSGTGN